MFGRKKETGSAGKVDRATMLRYVKFYLLMNYEDTSDQPRYSVVIGAEEHGKGKTDGGSPKNAEVGSGSVKYSLRSGDRYDGNAVRAAMRGISENASPQKTLSLLDQFTDKTFVDKMLELIGEKHLRDSAVYKAAQIDRRLFSKIASDRFYKPAKDTCIALCLALRLTLPETEDLLSRAGYTFSHSSRRDVILECFFWESFFDLTEINAILLSLGEKMIGRI